VNSPVHIGATPVQFEIQPAGAGERITGQFVFDMPQSQLVISWC